MGGVERQQVHEVVALYERCPPENCFDHPYAESAQPARVAHLCNERGDVDDDAEDDRVEELGDQGAEQALAPCDEAAAAGLSQRR
jgi:hypothetical protein